MRLPPSAVVRRIPGRGPPCAATPRSFRYGVSSHMSHIRPLAAAALLVAAASAQTLTLNGQSGNVDYYMGTTGYLRFDAPPGALAFWSFNVNPGPTDVGGLSVPIGLDAGLLEILGGAPTPAAGYFDLSFALPLVPALDGVTIYSLGAYVDLGAPPFFVSFTNQLAVVFRAQRADAGADAATFVGKAVTLDGGANDGLVGDLAYAWSVTSGPVGSNATLTGADTAFPVFTADLPGSYVVALNFGGADGPNVVPDAVVVDVFDLAFSSPVDGSFGTGTFNVAGTLAGPTVAGFAVNGVATSVGVGGAFNAGSLTPAPIGKVATATAEITTTGGAKLAKSVSRQIGVGNPIGSPALPAAGIRANGLTLDPLEAPVEQLLATVDFSTILNAIPPIPLINQQLFPGFILFSATAQPAGFTYDPTVDLEFAPGANCGVNTSITFTNVVLTVNVTGLSLNQPYTSVMTITSTATVVSGDLVFVTGANGLEAQIQNASADMQGFAYTATGVLGGLAGLGVIAPLIETALEAILAGTMQLLPPLVNPLLTQFNQTTFDLSAQGVPLSVGFPLATFCYDAAGITAGFGLTLAPQASGVPETPTLADYRTTPGALPVFGANTPLLNVPYTAAVAMNDDTLNVLLAAFTQLGALNLDLGTQLGATALNAGALAAALPGAGFEAFDPATPITLAVRHTTAPSVELAQAATTQGGFYLAGVALTFKAETAPGVLVPVFGATLSAAADVAFTYDINTQAFTVTTVNVVSTVAAGCNFPGGNSGATLGALNALVQPVVTQLAGAIAGLPIPAAGGGAGVQEVSVTGDNLVVYF